MTVSELKEQIQDVDGWLTNIEGAALFRLAEQCTGRGVIVEIGSWKGKSTIWLAHGSRSGAKMRLYAIDPHTGSWEHRRSGEPVWTFEEFRSNLRRFGVDELVTPILKASEDAATNFCEPIELLFIDGAHEYEAVLRDFDLWVPKVVEGGMVVLHDSNAGGIPILDNYLVEWMGPRRVAEQRILKSRGFCEARLADTLTIARKTEQASWLQVIRSRTILAFRLVYNTLFRFAPYWYGRLVRGVSSGSIRHSH